MNVALTIHVASPIVALTALLVNVSTVVAQSPPPAAQADSFVVVTPGPRYAKHGVFRAIAGRHYRELWTTPIKVPVLNLATFAGGLTPILAHSGSQTKSLRLKGADGREYQFRSVDKDPTATLAPELKGSAVGKALRDGVSASFPAAPVVASALLQAAGVLHVDQTLAVMPDDPRLGAFREDFKGVLGMIEERPGDMADEAGPYRAPRRVISPARAFAAVRRQPRTTGWMRARFSARVCWTSSWAIATGTAISSAGPPSPSGARFSGSPSRATMTRRSSTSTVSPSTSAGSTTSPSSSSRPSTRRTIVSTGTRARSTAASWSSWIVRHGIRWPGRCRRRSRDAVIEDAVRRMPPEMYPVGGAAAGASARAAARRTPPGGVELLRLPRARSGDSRDQCRRVRRDQPDG